MVKRCPTCGYNNRDDAMFCSSCGTSLTVAPAQPALKPVPSVRVVTPVSPGMPVRVPPPGMCYYHPSLPAVYVCNRCGRAICRDDSKGYMDLVLCPQCYQGVVPPVAAPAPGYGPQPYAQPYAPQPYAQAYAPPMPPAPAPMPYAAAPPPFYGPAFMGPAPARALWGFILSILGGILVIVNAAALLSDTFWDLWIEIFFWLPTIDTSANHGLAFAIGVVIGLIIVVGSIMMILGYGTIGSIVVFPLAVLSLVIGGGFVAGFVLGIIGGILGMIGR